MTRTRRSADRPPAPGSTRPGPLPPPTDADIDDLFLDDDADRSSIVRDLRGLGRTTESRAAIATVGSMYGGHSPGPNG